MAKFTETVTREINCPYCDESRVVKNGKQAGKQRYRCKGCRKQFNDTGALHGHRVPTNQVGAAIDMFYSGMSYKQIAEMMAKTFDIPEPSKRAIYEWVKDYTDGAVAEMTQHPAHTSGKWVADEMQVKVGGEQLWNWNVMDGETRYVLASHLSPNRDKRAAVAVMRKAAEASAEPPKSIKTDKLGSYTGAIKDVFPEALHIQSQGIRAFTNNNRSERLQGTFRQREKTLRGLDSLETGQRYLDGWVIDYNLFREHESLKGRTPGEAAKVSAPFTEWEDVVKASPSEDRARTARIRDARARLADAEMPPLVERKGVTFIGFKEPKSRGRRSPLVGTPARKVSPPAGKGGGVKVASATAKPKAVTSKAKVGGHDLLKALARRVTRFDWQNAPPDIAAILYETVIPPEERRTLGEYYTPAWLAQAMVEELVDDPLNQRVLDPACGSGTFIAAAVAHFLASIADAPLEPKELLERLRVAVTGIDVHPVAVHLARAAWALAARPAIEATVGAGYDASGSVPVYLGDALQLRFNAGDLFAGQQVTIQVDPDPIPGSANTELTFPISLVDRADTFDSLMSQVAADIERGDDPLLALDDHGVIDADPQRAGERQILAATIATLQQLHDQGRNHIWAYYTRNLVRPVALGRTKVDVIIGNPPWLSYRNTADILRAELENQCKSRYGIWAGGRYANRQDVAGLFFARSVDLYLKDGGMIGMVLPHSALQAGQYAKWRSGEWQSQTTGRGQSGCGADAGGELQPQGGVGSGATGTQHVLSHCVVRGIRKTQWRKRRGDGIGRVSGALGRQGRRGQRAAVAQRHNRHLGQRRLALRRLHTAGRVHRAALPVFCQRNGKHRRRGPVRPSRSTRDGVPRTKPRGAIWI